MVKPPLTQELTLHIILSGTQKLSLTSKKGRRSRQPHPELATSTRCLLVGDGICGANARPMRWTSLLPCLADHAAESVRLYEGTAELFGPCGPMRQIRFWDLWIPTLQAVAWGSCRMPCRRRTAMASLTDPHGDSWSSEHDLHENVASGNMDDNITRLPLPNATFGRPWLLPRQCCGPGASSFPLGPRSHVRMLQETCACGAARDILGRHRAACPRSGLSKSRVGSQAGQRCEMVVHWSILVCRHAPGHAMRRFVAGGGGCWRCLVIAHKSVPWYLGCRTQEVDGPTPDLADLPNVSHEVHVWIVSLGLTVWFVTWFQQRSSAHFAVGSRHSGSHSLGTPLDRMRRWWNQRRESRDRPAGSADNGRRSFSWPSFGLCVTDACLTVFSTKTKNNDTNGFQSQFDILNDTKDCTRYRERL